MFREMPIDTAVIEKHPDEPFPQPNVAPPGSDEPAPDKKSAEERKRAQGRKFEKKWADEEIDEEIDFDPPPQSYAN